MVAGTELVEYLETEPYWTYGSMGTISARIKYPIARAYDRSYNRQRS